MQFNDSDVPLHRQAHQRYVFLLFETLPLSRDEYMFRPRDFFNWTMSHRRDSDIYDPHAYGFIESKETSSRRFPPMLTPSETLEGP